MATPVIPLCATCRVWGEACCKVHRPERRGWGWCAIGCDCEACNADLAKDMAREERLQGQRENDAYDNWKDSRRERE